MVTGKIVAGSNTKLTIFISVSLDWLVVFSTTRMNFTRVLVA